MSIYALYIKKLLTNLNIETTFFFLPTKERKLILLRSPHVNKKSKEHFKIQYFRLVLNVNLMTESADKVFV